MHAIRTRRAILGLAAGVPGKPMPLGELAALMKADYEKLTTVVKASGMTAP
jgi:hypothetical protein